MKKYLVLVILLSTTLAFAQSNYQDVVYLKDGSIVRGSIIEQIPNKTIKIETVDRSIFVYQTKEIEKLTKEPYQLKKHKKYSKETELPEYKAIIELGYSKFYDYHKIKLNITYNYQLSPYYSLGFGTGLRYTEDFHTIPVFMNFRTNFTKNNYSPYLSLGLGYLFTEYNFEAKGFMFDPTVGVVFKITDKSALNVGLNYEIIENYDYFERSPGVMVGILF